MVLVMSSVIAVVVVSLASYTISSLSYGQVVENRSDQLSAADAGMRYAIDQLKLRNAGCILDTQESILPGVQADFNGATASVTCVRITSGFEGIQAYAAVMTGEGVPPGQDLLSSQSGSNAKVLGGPVYMSRIGPSDFDLDPPIDIKDGPLLYPDSAEPCISVKPSTLPADLRFDPPLIYGPICVNRTWDELFDSPDVPDLTGLIERDGILDLASSPALPLPQGSFADDINGCRVFEPGRYTTPPDLDGYDAYFKTGDYLFDFTGPDTELLVSQGVVTAGRVNPFTTISNDIPNAACVPAQNADAGVVPDDYGATFYFAGDSHINVAVQGSLEIHTRQQGTADYVSVQTLCDPISTPKWCNPSGGGNFIPAKASTLTAPKTGSNPNFLFTDSGNNKEFVAHGLVYAPLTQVEFGNVSNTATQKMLGGLIVSRLVLQSSTSATNFEISVPTSPITARIQLTSTGTKDGATSIRAVVEYRPYDKSGDIDERIRVNSWRVCEVGGC
jgi:hypothetical protein